MSESYDAPAAADAVPTEPHFNWAQTVCHLIVLFLTASAALPGAAHAAQPPKPTSRGEATDVVRNLRRIVTPNGVDMAQAVQIGGIDQWVTVRGSDRRNPVLLVLHGGPGYVELPVSWWYTRGWEEYFTVVQWDQRGAGKTYLLNDPAKVGPTMNRAQMVRDSEDLVGWVRKAVGKDKVFIWGHSWGSYLGIELARRHPDWFYAYIATGQITNAPESERRGWAYDLAQARDTHNLEAEHALTSVAPYPAAKGPSPIEHIALVHRWTDYFGGVMADRHDQEDESHAGRLSPDYSDADATHIYDGNAFSERYLLADVLSLDLTNITDLKCPLILLSGRHDRTVNSDVAHEWFTRVRAPFKQFVWFEHSAHEPETEEPGKFLLSLVQYARPFAARAGDVAP